PAVDAAVAARSGRARSHVVAPLGHSRWRGPARLPAPATAHRGTGRGRSLRKDADWTGTPVPGWPEPTQTRCSPAITRRVPAASTALRSRASVSNTSYRKIVV